MTETKPRPSLHWPAWIAALALLLLPVIATRLSAEVDWDHRDFLVFAAMLITACGMWELCRRAQSGGRARLGLSLLIFVTFILIWLSLGVGIIGADGNRANALYLLVPLTGITGALLTRFRPVTGAQIAYGMAATQLAIVVLGIAFELGNPVSAPAELLLVNGPFIAMYLIAGRLLSNSDKPLTNNN